MDIGNHIGSGERKQLVVALDIAGKVRKTRAPVLRFAQAKTLDHSAHGSIQDGDAMAQDFGKRLGAGIDERFHALHFRPRPKPQSVQ